MKILALVIALSSFQAMANDLYATAAGKKDDNLTVEVGCLTGQFKTDDLGKTLLTEDEYKKSFKKVKTDAEKSDLLEVNLGLRNSLAINGVDQPAQMLVNIDVSVGDKKDRLKIKTCLAVGEDLKAALSKRDGFGFNNASVTLKRNGSVTYLPGEIGGEGFLTLLGAPRPFNVNLAFPVAYANADYASAEASGAPGTAITVFEAGQPLLAFGNYAETRASLTAKGETAVALFGLTRDRDQAYVINVRGFGRVGVVVLARNTSEEATKLAATLKEKFQGENFVVYTYDQLADLNKQTPNPVIDVLKTFLK